MSPLPSDPDYAPFVVGSEGIDTNERTVPFKVQRQELSSTSSPSGSYPERVESSTPATITAERYPDMHPAWDGPTQGRPDEMIPSTPSSLSRPTPSLWARYGRTLLIGVVVFFSLVCVILVGLILR